MPDDHDDNLWELAPDAMIWWPPDDWQQPMPTRPSPRWSKPKSPAKAPIDNATSEWLVVAMRQWRRDTFWARASAQCDRIFATLAQRGDRELTTPPLPKISSVDQSNEHHQPITNEAQMSNHIPTNLERARIIEEALYTRVIEACEHVGPDSVGFPNLCFPHPSQGIMCDECLVLHNQLDHTPSDIVAQKCAMCRRTLDPIDDDDDPTHTGELDTYVMTDRRSLPYPVNVTNVVTAVTKPSAVDGHIDHITYDGTTVIWCERWLCFRCRAARDKATFWPRPTEKPLEP